MTLDDIRVMEEAGEELMRLNRTRKGLALLALALKFREELRLDHRFGFSVRVPERFACDVDESAGLAEIVNLEERRT